MKFSCPQCSGKISLSCPTIIVKCPFCKSSLFIDLDGISVAYSFKPIVEMSQVEGYLKRDFERVGFREQFKIVEAFPVYLPFWKVEGCKQLERASGLFPDERVDMPSGVRIFFDSESIDMTQVIEINSQPDTPKSRDLYYLPYFIVTVSFKGKKYPFFVNAVNGAIRGDRLPHLSVKKAFQLFPLFIGIFLLFCVVNYLTDHLFVAIGVNILIFFLCYRLSITIIEKKLYKR